MSRLQLRLVMKPRGVVSLQGSNAAVGWNNLLYFRPDGTIKRAQMVNHHLGLKLDDNREVVFDGQ